MITLEHNHHHLMTFVLYKSLAVIIQFNRQIKCNTEKSRVKSPTTVNTDQYNGDLQIMSVILCWHLKLTPKVFDIEVVYLYEYVIILNVF